VNKDNAMSSSKGIHFYYYREEDTAAFLPIEAAVAAYPNPSPLYLRHKYYIA
jgi:hypothetical protein